MTEQEVAKTITTSVRQCIYLAVKGAIRIPQEGVDYLPSELNDIEDFEAHPWVRNAVILAFSAGALRAYQAPNDFGITSDDCRMSGLLVALGHDVFSAMEKVGNRES